MLTDPYSKAPAILIIGKTGSGKSTLANMLFEEKEKFKASDSSDSCTEICQSALLKFNDEEYNVVDTPGIFDTMNPSDKAMKEIAQSIVQCSNGIIAILYVIKWNKYRKEQQITTRKILEFLGEDSLYHLIVVFTGCKISQTNDRFKMEDDFNVDLKSFLKKIGNRWFISPDPDNFDINDSVVKSHINGLKSYIKLMPKPYTTDLFERVRVAREKELKKIEDCEKKTVEKVEEMEKKKKEAGTIEAEKEFNNKGCFSLCSKVILANGKRIEMSHLRIGDKVCCGEENGKLIFSKIYAIVHADNQTATQYQKIDYLKADGTEGSLRLTPKHHIFISQGKTIFAEDVRASVTELLLFDGKKLTPVIPHRVTKEWELGYIAPFTQNGKIVADEILCSCYAVAPPYQDIINFSMIPFRFYSWIINDNSPVVDHKKEISPYLCYLKRGQWILEQIDYFNAMIKGS